MNKFVLFSLAALLVLSSCSKKTHPTVSKTNKEPEHTVVVAKKEPETKPVTDTPVTTPNPAPEAAAAVFNSPMIVIDESGRVVTPADKLPADLSARVDYKKIAKGFSADQRKNLIYRFKMVPPKVLFVPADMSQKSAKGTYVIYKKKFYYWKKDDGLFHLDETYYSN